MTGLRGKGSGPKCCHDADEDPCAQRKGRRYEDMRVAMAARTTHNVRMVPPKDIW